MYNFKFAVILNFKCIIVILQINLQFVIFIYY